MNEIIDESKTQSPSVASGCSAADTFPEPRTELAQLALKARADYIASGEPLLTLEEINMELDERRGTRD